MGLNRSRRTVVGALAAGLLVSTAQSPHVYGVEPGIPLRIGLTRDLFSGVSIRDAQLAMQMWGQSVCRRIDPHTQLKLIILDDLPAAMRAMAASEIELLGMTGLDFVRTQHTGLLEPLVIGLWGKDRRATVEYLLLSRRDRGIADIADLQGASLVLGTPASGRTVRMWLDILLMKERLPPSCGFFRAIKKVDKASQAAMPVFFGQADACVVARRDFRTMAELNPQLGRDLRILAVSPGILTNLMCARKDLDRTLRQSVLDAALKLHTESDGQQLLMLFRTDQTVHCTTSYLHTTALLLQEYQQLSQEIGTP